MSKDIKVIELNLQSLSDFNDQDPLKDEGSWHVIYGKKLSESTDFSFEYWRTEKNFDEVKVRRERKTTYKIFPSRKLNLSDFNLGEYFPKLISELRKEIEENDIIIHLHGLYNFQASYLLYNLPEDVPIIAQSHGGLPARLRKKESSSLTQYFNIVRRILQDKTYHKVDYFHLLNRDAVDEMETYGETRFQPVGVDFDFHKKRETEQTKKIGYIGRIERDKGFLHLLEAFRDIDKDYILVVAGQGSAMEEAKSFVSDNDLDDKIEFRGWVEDVRDIYYEVDFTVYPSKREGYGVVPIESMACGTPTVVSDAGDMPGMVEDFGAGIVFERPVTTGKIRESLLDMISKSSFDVSEEGRERAKERRGWSSIKQNTVDDLNSLRGSYF